MSGISDCTNVSGSLKTFDIEEEAYKYAAELNSTATDNYYKVEDAGCNIGDGYPQNVWIAYYHVVETNNADEAVTDECSYKESFLESVWAFLSAAADSYLASFARSERNRTSATDLYYGPKF